MAKFSKKFGALFKSLDMYGQDINVLYRGESKYRTWFGAAFTLITYALIIFNLASLTIAFWNGTKQEET